MTKIFHGDIKIDEEEHEAVSQEIRSGKILPRVKKNMKQSLKKLDLEKYYQGLRDI